MGRVVIVSLFFMSSWVAAAAGPEVEYRARVALGLSGRELRVDANLEPGLPPEVEERLRAGLPATAVWEIRLFVDRGIWFSGAKDEREYVVTATWRPLRADYLVERRLDGKLLETRSVPAMKDAVTALLSVKSLPSFIMGPHLVDKPLFVKARCTYAAVVTLGVVPTTLATPWAKSETFEWKAAKEP
jgi:hypothetical protein